jgi:hypothetical protein
MNLGEKIYWAAYLRALQFKHALSDKVTETLIDLYLGDA